MSLSITKGDRMDYQRLKSPNMKVFYERIALLNWILKTYPDDDTVREELAVLNLELTRELICVAA